MNALILIAIFFLLVVVAEFAARLYVRKSPYRVLPPGREDRMQLDRTILPSLEATVIHKVNQYGERGSERPTSPNSFRVLVAGGSAVSCYMLDQYTAWPGALEKALQGHAIFGTRPVHVGNIGQSGVDSASLHLMLSRLLPQEDTLDVIVLMVGASDVLRWLEIGAPADRAADAIAVGECFARHPEVNFGWHPKDWAIATLYRWHRDAIGKSRTNSGRRYAATRAMRANATETRTIVPHCDVVLERFELQLRRCLKLAALHAKHVVFLRQPWFRKYSYLPEELAQFWNGSVGDAYVKDVSIFYAPEVVSELMAQIDARAAFVATELGITAPDISHKLDSTNANYWDQIHVTPVGSKIIAEGLTETIIRALRDGQSRWRTF